MHKHIQLVLVDVQNNKCLIKTRFPFLHLPVQLTPADKPVAPHSGQSMKQKPVKRKHQRLD